VKRTVECFYPGRSFPSISVTGAECALDCKHCSRKYLEGMIPATSPDDLASVAEALVERGARGFLLSGGVDKNGKVGLSEFLPTIAEIKATTDLKINAHVGLAPSRELEELVGIGIDSFSIDLYGSDDTVREVLGLDAKADDYFKVASDLAELNAHFAPHICVGIHGGKLKGELAAISRLRDLSPRTLAFISLIPTKGTQYASVRPPNKQMLLEVVRCARSELPDTKLMLGCMRSKSDRSWEPDMIEAGLDGIVLPAAKTVDLLRARGYGIRKRAECCALI